MAPIALRIRRLLKLKKSCIKYNENGLMKLFSAYAVIDNGEICAPGFFPTMMLKSLNIISAEYKSSKPVNA
jgi:hypothetical protein